MVSGASISGPYAAAGEVVLAAVDAAIGAGCVVEVAEDGALFGLWRLWEGWEASTTLRPMGRVIVAGTCGQTHREDHAILIAEGAIAAVRANGALAVSLAQAITYVALRLLAGPGTDGNDRFVATQLLGERLRIYSYAAEPVAAFPLPNPTQVRAVLTAILLAVTGASTDEVEALLTALG